jgi:hypothetical protein
MLSLLLSLPLSLSLPSDDIPTAHTPGPGSGGPISPGGCGNAHLPPPVLANCTDPLTPGIPDMRGSWEGAALGKDDHWERIEQCGDRIVWTSGCVVHDFRHADGNVSHGVDDYSGIACVPIKVAGVFNATCSILKPLGLFTAVTRCLNPDHTMLVHWGPTVGTLKRTNRTHGVEQCDR